MLSGDSQHRFHAGLAGRGQSGGGVQEAFHWRTWGVNDERDGVGRRLVTDSVRSAAGQRHGLASLRGAALHVAVHVLYVEGELAVDDVVGLARIMSMHHRWTATGVHPQVDGEECALVSEAEATTDASSEPSDSFW